MATHPQNWRRLGRLAGLVLAPVAVMVGVLLGPPWIEAILGRWAPRITVVSMLVGLAWVYVVAVVAAGLGAPAIGWGLYRARRHGAARPGMARGLSACAGGLVAMAMAEAISAAWLAHQHRPPAPVADDPTLPGRFEAADGGEATITVLGGSSAQGMPYHDWLSIGRIVAWQLGRVEPSRRVRLDSLAVGGADLADQHRKLAAVGHRPDILIIYSGHNEFSANVPWSRRVGHYLDDRPVRAWSLEEAAARVSPFCALVHETADRRRIASRPRDGRPPPLVDAPAYTADEYRARLSDFRRRLEDIAAFGDRIGATTILIIPPGNDAGFDPNRSFLPPSTPRIERESFARDFRAVRRAEGSDPTRAIAGYRTLLDRQPGFAESHYRLARLLARNGDREGAYRHFVAARDLDGLPMRCPTAFQDAYRDVAARHPAAILIDGQALFRAIGRDGLLDDDLFHDAMHPSLRGHIAMAQAVLDAIAGRGAAGWPPGEPSPRIDPTECAAHFGIRPEDWRGLALRGMMFYFAVAPLRHDAEQRLAKRNVFLSAAARIAAGKPAGSVGLPNLGVPAAPPLAADAVVRSGR